METVTKRRTKNHHSLPYSKNEFNDKVDLYTKDFCKHIGNYLKSVRLNKKISLRDIYRLTGVSIAIATDLESGKKLPKIDTIIKLALVLDADLNIVFGGKVFTQNKDKKEKKYDKYCFSHIIDCFGDYSNPINVHIVIEKDCANE